MTILTFQLTPSVSTILSLLVRLYFCMISNFLRKFFCNQILQLSINNIFWDYLRTQVSLPVDHIYYLSQWQPVVLVVVGLQPEPVLQQQLGVVVGAVVDEGLNQELVYPLLSNINQSPDCIYQLENESQFCRFQFPRWLLQIFPRHCSGSGGPGKGPKLAVGVCRRIPSYTQYIPRQSSGADLFDLVWSLGSYSR